MWGRVAATFVLAVLLAGCGDDDRISISATSEAPATVTSTVPESRLAWARVPDEEGVFAGAGSRRIVSLAAGGPGLVAAGYEDSPGEAARPAVWVSADGYAWTRIDDEAAFGGGGGEWIYSVTAGGPGLVAAGYEASVDFVGAAVWVSADGYSWTRIHDDAVFGRPGDLTIVSVTAGGPGLVAVGYEESVDYAGAAVWVSADGYAWTRVPYDEAAFGGAGDQRILSVSAGGPGLVAVGYDVSGDDSDGAVWVSADGYAWTRVDDGAVLGGTGNQSIVSVIAGGPGLVAVGSEGLEDSDAAVWVSADGYTWARIPHDEAVFGGLGEQQILSVAAAGPLLVAGGYDIIAGALDAAVWVSPPPG
jgi:hypothetical protein